MVSVSLFLTVCHVCLCGGQVRWLRRLDKPGSLDDGFVEAKLLFKALEVFHLELVLLHLFLHPQLFIHVTIQPPTICPSVQHPLFLPSICPPTIRPSYSSVAELQSPSSTCPSSVLPPVHCTINSTINHSVHLSICPASFLPSISSPSVHPWIIHLASSPFR